MWAKGLTEDRRVTRRVWGFRNECNCLQLSTSLTQPAITADTSRLEFVSISGVKNMDAKALRDLARRYQDNREFITNEEMTKASLIVPFITAIGYDTSSPREVRLEYTAEFTVNDGKRLPDRMDYAIFDATGQIPILAIEAKPLGADVRARSPQLARYMSQLPQLRFGIITDGCDYLFYRDRGGGIYPAGPLPHHPACGSAPGGSKS